MNQAVIKSIAAYLPEQVVYNAQIEDKIHVQNGSIESGILEKLFGGKMRRIAPLDMQVSDLACAAAKKILNERNAPSIDMLIFAAASSDLIEPATANIVQAKLGLNCPVMDVKNACNSFVSAMQVASAFVSSGVYKNILIVGGEKLSEVVNFSPKDQDELKKSLAGYTLGDGGAAIIIGAGEGSKMVFQKFNSWGEHWNLCTVEGGGSMAYRDLNKHYFVAHSAALHKAFGRKILSFVPDCLKEAGWSLKELDLVVAHQVSADITDRISAGLGINPSKFIKTFYKYGNTAAVTVPIALHEAFIEGRLKKGDKVMLLGLAAGISLSVQLIEW
jgi:acyl-CoA:acyl-CoA alkyltransferase